MYDWLNALPKAELHQLHLTAVAFAARVVEYALELARRVAHL